MPESNTLERIPSNAIDFSTCSPPRKISDHSAAQSLPAYCIKPTHSLRSHRGQEPHAVANSQVPRDTYSALGAEKRTIPNGRPTRGANIAHVKSNQHSRILATRRCCERDRCDGHIGARARSGNRELNFKLDVVYHEICRRPSTIRCRGSGPLPRA